MERPGPVVCVEIRPEVTTSTLGHVKVANAFSGGVYTHSSSVPESGTLKMMLIQAVCFRKKPSSHSLSLCLSLGPMSKDIGLYLIGFVID